MAAAVSGTGTAWSNLWVKSVLACPVVILRIRMTGDHSKGINWPNQESGH